MASANEIWLAIRNDVAPFPAIGSGTGSPSDPYAANTPDAFAKILSGLPANILVRLLPGSYYTWGRPAGDGCNFGSATPAPPGFDLKAGQKIIGSGMFLTTLRFVWDNAIFQAGINGATSYDPAQRHTMLAASPTNEFLASPVEISDLTLDGNLQSLPGFTQTKDSTAYSGPVTATVSGTTMTSSAAFFTPYMTGATVQFSLGTAQIVSITDATHAVLSSSIVFTGSLPFSVITTAITSGTAITTTTPFFSSAMIGSTLVFNGTNAYARITAVTDAQHATLNASLGVSSGTAFKVFGVRFTVKALSVLGDNLLIRRVRVINFGTLTPYYFDGLAAGDPGYPGGPNRTYEGFPFGFGGRTGSKAAFNNVAKDCIFEQPFAGPGREVTCAVMGSGIDSSADPTLGERLHMQPMGCAIRNCYFNFEYINPRLGNPVRIASSFYDTSTGDFTVKTEFPADLAVGDFVEIYGSDVPALNGRWPVTGLAPLDSLSQLQLTFKLGLGSGASGATMGFAFKSPLQTMSASLSATQGSTSVTVNTGTPHKRTAGDWVCISGCSADEFNGTFRVSSVPNSLSFTYTLASAASTGTPGGAPCLDRRPNFYVFIQNATTDPVTLIAKLTTYGPHYMKPGDWVPISFVATGSPATTNNAYNNYVQVVAAPMSETNTRLNLYVQLFSALNATDVANGVGNFAGGFQAMTGNGGYGGGLLSNRVANCIHGGTYHDFWWENQFIGRRNISIMYSPGL